MADWSAPFHMPNMTDEVFSRRRREAIEKDGYKVRFPPLKDIIHVPAEEPITEEEEREWRKPGHGNIPPARKEELERVQRDKRDKYDAMLRDPSPDIARSRSAIMAAIDDAQDALATLAVMGRLALPLLPAGIAGALGGPLTWLLSGAMLLNFMNALMKPGIPSRKAKRLKDKLSKNNPFSQKGKAQAAKELARKGLHSGNLIEAAQVTDNIWGAGICLGPLMALPITVGSGLAREVMGQDVEWSFPPTDWKHWQRAAGRALHSLPALWGDTPFLSDTDMMGLILAGHFAQQAFPATEVPCEGLKNIEVVKTLELKAPTPTNILTREVIEEAGDDPDDRVKWPSTDEEWSNINTLTDKTYLRAMSNIHGLYNRNADNVMGYYAGAFAGEAGLYAVENVGGLNSVKTSYTVASRAVTGLMDGNWKFPDNIQPWQIDRLGERLDYWEEHDMQPGPGSIVRDTLYFASHYCGFRFIQAT